MIKTSRGKTNPGQKRYGYFDPAFAFNGSIRCGSGIRHPFRSGSHTGQPVQKHSRRGTKSENPGWNRSMLLSQKEIPMERLTQKLPKGGYQAKADASFVLERLGRLEDLYDALTAERDKIAARMEELRGQGKVKTAAYQQNMAHKLMLQGLMDRMDIYAGETPGAKK